MLMLVSLDCVLASSNLLVLVMAVVLLFFFFKQKPAYRLRISDWSSDVCSSDLQGKLSNMHGLAIAAEMLDRPIPKVWLTTFRAPYTPVTYGTLVGHSRGDLFDPTRKTPMHDLEAAAGAEFEDVGNWKRAWYFPRRGEDMAAAVNRECRTVRDEIGRAHV